jgi:hypothetical protein
MPTGTVEDHVEGTTAATGTEHNPLDDFHLRSSKSSSLETSQLPDNLFKVMNQRDDETPLQEENQSLDSEQSPGNKSIADDSGDLSPDLHAIQPTCLGKDDIDTDDWNTAIEEAERDDDEGELRLALNETRETDSSRFTSSKPSRKTALDPVLSLKTIDPLEIETAQRPKEFLTELAPELLTAIAELLQGAGDLADVLYFAMSCRFINQAIQLVLSRHALWYDLESATLSVVCWVRFCARKNGDLAE